MNLRDLSQACLGAEVAAVLRGLMSLVELAVEVVLRTLAVAVAQEAEEAAAVLELQVLQTEPATSDHLQINNTSHLSHSPLYTHYCTSKHTASRCT